MVELRALALAVSYATRQIFLSDDQLIGFDGSQIDFVEHDLRAATTIWSNCDGD